MPPAHIPSLEPDLRAISVARKAGSPSGQRRFDSTALQNSWDLLLRVSSGKQKYRESPWAEHPASLLGAKLLLLDGWGQLYLDVHQGPLHHHQGALLQQVHKQQGLQGRKRETRLKLFWEQHKQL